MSESSTKNGNSPAGTAKKERHPAAGTSTDHRRKRPNIKKTDLVKK
jgi:hypothetical protein